MARALGCGILALVLLAVGACGPANTAGAPPSPASSPSPTSSPTSVPTLGTTPTPTPASAQSGAGCQASQLSLSTGGRNAGAGTVQETFIFTNTSQTACSLFGYPGMQMTSGGQPIPTKVVRTPATEQTVMVAPGGTASFVAQWHSQTGYTTPCATSQQVEVTPPNATAQLTVTDAIQACPDGTINVNPVTAGSTGGQ